MSMRRWTVAWLVLRLASLVGSTGFATCGSDVPDDQRAAEEEQGAGEATIREEQRDMERDIDR